MASILHILSSCGCYDYVWSGDSVAGGMASVGCTQTDEWFYHHLSQAARGCVECCGSAASCTQTPTCKLLRVEIHPENRSQLAVSGMLF